MMVDAQSNSTTTTSTMTNSLFQKIRTMSSRKKKPCRSCLSTNPDFKVVTLGESHCGKTSLVQWFLNQRPPSSSETGATVAASFSRHLFEDPEAPLDKDGYVMGLWDTAGSERFCALAKLYYRDVFGALLCYDVSNQSSWDRIQYWINELNENQPGCRIYIIGCKADLPREICPEKVTALAEAHNTVFFETSSKTGFQINEVFEWIYADFKEQKRIEEKLEPQESESNDRLSFQDDSIIKLRHCQC